MGDDKANLIHMGRQQQTVPCGFGSLLEYNQVAKSIGSDGIGIGLRLSPEKGAHLSFISGHAVEQTELLQQFKHRWAPPSQNP